MTTISVQTRPLPPGSEVGGYVVESVLGEGGAATVYRARSPHPQREDAAPHAVALKILKPHATKQPQALACFQFESRVLARLEHPGILRVYDAGIDDGNLFTAMELIDGVALDRFLLAQKRLDEPAAQQIVSQVALALDYLHQQGYVHRDIKPANIMLTQNRRAVLFDFGTVIRIRDGAAYETGLFGTPAFLAPEQIEPGRQIDGRADLYGLGMILYLMVAGRKPYYGSRSEVLGAHLSAELPKPSEFAPVSADLEAIILRALAKDPADRFLTGQEFSDALAAAELLPSRSKKPTWIKRITGWLQA